MKVRNTPATNRATSAHLLQHKAARLTIAHINDTHSYFEPNSLQLTLTIDGQIIRPYVSAGGFARIVTRAQQLKQQARQQQRGFLFLHAGDCFQGTLYFSLFKGQANADMLNALQLDAMVLGNHELDMGNEPVAQFLRRIDFPFLAGNWDISAEQQDKKTHLSGQTNLLSYQPEQQCAAWLTHYVDEEAVAIFGLSLDKMADISNPDSDTPFVDARQVALNTVAAIQAQGINKIILLSHLGYEADLQLAAEVAGISVIIGGHSHRLQGDFSALGLSKDDEYGQCVNGTYVVQAGYHALSLGHCEIDFHADGSIASFNGCNEVLFGRRLCIDATLAQANDDGLHQKACNFLQQHPNVVVCKKDPLVHQLLLTKYMPKVRELQQTVVSQAQHSLRHVRIPDQHGGSELAPLVAESFHYHMSQQGHKVDFAIHNAGGVRNSLHPGSITVADIAGKLLPFAVPIGVYQIQGQYLAQVIEGAINNATNNGVQGTGSGSYPYCFNLRFAYVAENPVGQRVTQLQIRDKHGYWTAPQAKRVYCGTSSAYTMKGKEGYEAILHMQSQLVTSISMADCFIAFLQQQEFELPMPNSSQSYS